MPAILHLGHQPADISVDPSMLTTNTLYFDATLDVNGILYQNMTRNDRLCWSVGFRAASDFFVGFRQVRPSSAYFENLGIFDMLALVNALGDVVGGVEFYHTASNQGFRTRAFVVTAGGRVYGPIDERAPNGTTYWFDLGYSYDSGLDELTVSFYVDAVPVSVITDTPLAAFDKNIVGMKSQLPGAFTGGTQNVGIAHVSVIEEASTVGRRFIRREPSVAGVFAEWTGDVTLLGDGVSSIMTNAVNQRSSFVAGAGPAIPPGAAITGIHIAVRGEPSATLGNIRPFVRVGGSNYENGFLTFDNNRITKQVLTFDLNPATAAIWTGEPDEYGVLSGS